MTIHPYADLRHWKFIWFAASEREKLERWSWKSVHIAMEEAMDA